MTWNRSTEQAYSRAQRREVKRLGRAEEGRDRLGETLSVQADLLMDVLAVVLASGSGILFGTTRAGSAVVVNLYVDNELRQGYATDAAGFQTLLDDARDVCTAKLGGTTQGPPKAPHEPNTRKLG